MEKENFIDDLNVGGTLYKVNGNVLYQRNKPKNKVRIQELSYSQGCYNGYLSRVDKCLYGPSSLKERSLEEMVKVSIIQDFLSPFLLDQQEVQALNTESIKNKYGVVMIDEPMNARLNGTLPRTKILDSWYTVDLESRVLRNIVHPNHDLRIPNASICFGGCDYYYFLKDSHSLDRVDLKALMVPSRALLLEVPADIDLCFQDPSGIGSNVSKQEKLAWTSFLWNTELRMLPLEASNIQDIIDMNHFRQQLVPIARDSFVIKSDEHIKAQLNPEVFKQRIGRGFRS